MVFFRPFGPLSTTWGRSSRLYSRNKLSGNSERRPKAHRSASWFHSVASNGQRVLISHIVQDSAVGHLSAVYIGQAATPSYSLLPDRSHRSSLHLKDLARTGALPRAAGTMPMPKHRPHLLRYAVPSKMAKLLPPRTPSNPLWVYNTARFISARTRPPGKSEPCKQNRSRAAKQPGATGISGDPS